MTFISRVTGLLREMVFAYYFGATAAMDAFNIAYRIPNFLRNIFGDGAFSQAFVPVLSEYRQSKTGEEVSIFLGRVAGNISLITFLLTFIAILIAPVLVYIFAPGFVHDSGRFALTVSMLRITFPYVIFISLSACVSGILNSYDRFGVPAFMPTIFNLVLIASAIFLAPYFSEPVKALAWGIFIGGALQLCCQLPFLPHLGIKPRLQISWRDENIKKVLKLMGPAILGVSVAQISFLVDNILASFLQVGSVSWLNYSTRLAMFPLGLFGVAIATVILPHLAREYAMNSMVEFSKTLDWAMRWVLIISIPAALGLAMLAGPIIMVLFQFKGGQFSLGDIFMVRRSLLALVLGIPAFMLVKILASSFYSRQNVKIPASIAIVSLGINMILAFILILPLKHAGLALATSLASVINALLLLLMLKRSGYYTPTTSWQGFSLKIIFANAMLFLLLYYTSQDLSRWLEFSRMVKIFRLLTICGVAIITYIFSLGIMGIRLRDLIPRK